MAVEISLSPIRAANGLSVLASVVDVTARKEAESEWRRSQEEIAHLSRVAVLGELSGALAHELNQPLAGILSNAQAAQRFLARDPVDLTEVRAILADIVADDKRAGDIIHRMRQLLKKGEVPRQPLGLNDIVHEVLALVRGDLATHGITARTDLAPDLPVVHADHVQLRQVLLNLVINACDAMSALAPGDRQLLVRTSPADPADGQSVQVSVSDGGVGIPADDLDRIFDSYFTTKAHGLGLGLSLCRTIITAHGGRVWATNNVDRGATLCFTLPAVTTSR